MKAAHMIEPTCGRPQFGHRITRNAGSIGPLERWLRVAGGLRMGRPEGSENSDYDAVEPYDKDAWQEFTRGGLVIRAPVIRRRQAMPAMA